MGKAHSLTKTTGKIAATALCLLVIMLIVNTAQAQVTPSPSPSVTPAPTPTTPVATPSAPPVLKTIKLTVTYAPKVPVARKQFYLSRVPFNLEELQKSLGSNLPSHKDYLHKVSGPALSEELVAEFIREWLERYKCETVYCQPILAEDVGRIRVFKPAYESAKNIFKDTRDADGMEMALKWLPNFLPQEIRTGYFDMKRAWIARAIEHLEKSSGEKNVVRPVMTDRKGEAYITEVRPATYYISNLIPIEDGKDCFLWNTKKEVKEGPGLEVGVTLGTGTKLKEIKGANAAALTFTCAPPK